MNKAITLSAIAGIVVVVSLAGTFNQSGVDAGSEVSIRSWDNVNITVMAEDVNYSMNDYWSVHVIQPNGDMIYQYRSTDRRATVWIYVDKVERTSEGGGRRFR